MRPPKAIRNRFQVPGFLINSLPKAGTHLVARAIELFPGLRFGRIHLGQRTFARWDEDADSEVPTIPIGVDWPRSMPVGLVRESLRRVRNGRFATMHVAYSEALADLIAGMGMKSLLILRDPRDVVLSHAAYVASRRRHFLHEHYQNLTDAERVMASIVGVEQTAPGGPMLLDINRRGRSVMPWAERGFSHTCRFERLVGAKGGGTREAQVDELAGIAGHLGFEHDSGDIERVADRLFGGTRTFRKGKIGGWRERFSPEHTRAFKEVAGQLLVDLGYESDLDW